MAKLSLVVMAAGLGSRFGGLKQVEPVGPGGEMTLAYSVYDALRAGFDKIVFIIRKDTLDIFRERIGAVVERRAETRYVFQGLSPLPGGFALPSGREKPWGTGHAVLCAREAVAEPFLVINGDDFYGRSPYQSVAAFFRAAGRRDSDGCMVGFRLRNTLSAHGTVSRAICRVDGTGLLQGTVERTKIRAFGDAVRYADGDAWLDVPGDATVSMNMWGLTPAIFPHLDKQWREFLAERAADTKSEFILPGAIDQMIRSGEARIQVLPTEEAWHGITYREDLPALQEAVREMIRRGDYPERLWA